MRIHDLQEAEEPFNLVPLTDMVFNLLIFFLCATTFVQIEKDMAVQLPRTSSNFAPLSAQPQELIINITKDGSRVINGKTVKDDELLNLVTKAVKARPDQTVIIRADRNSIMEYFAHTAEICKNAHVNTAKLVYLDEKR